MATPHVDVPLPERTTSKLRIVYPRVGEPITAVSHSSKVRGVMMHWGEKNSFPCIRDVAHCPWCEIRLRKLWYGWIVGVETQKRGRALIQLTESAVRSSLNLSDSNVDLRGARIELSRVASGKGSFVRAGVTVCSWKDYSQHDDPDVFALLLAFYKIQLPHVGDQADEKEGGE